MNSTQGEGERLTEKFKAAIQLFSCRDDDNVLQWSVTSKRFSARSSTSKKAQVKDGVGGSGIQVGPMCNQLVGWWVGWLVWLVSLVG